MRFVRPTFELIALAGLLAVSTACASASVLDETQVQVASLQQTVDTLTADLTAARERVSSLEQDVSGLRVDLNTARSNVADMREDLTSASSDLGALKNTFLLSQDQRDTQHQTRARQTVCC